LQDREFAEQVARNLLRAFSLPLDIDGRSETVITPSIGISLFPDHALVPTDLLKFADTAMYAAKDGIPASSTRKRWMLRRAAVRP